jgi:hypothetical protein
VRCGADERRALEPPCRCVTRPALANERVQANAAGQVVLRLKKPWRDGTTEPVMSPRECTSLPIECQLRGGQTHRSHVCSGSC